MHNSYSFICSSHHVHPFLPSTLLLLQVALLIHEPAVVPLAVRFVAQCKNNTLDYQLLPTLIHSASSSSSNSSSKKRGDGGTLKKKREEVMPSTSCDSKERQRAEDGKGIGSLKELETNVRLFLGTRGCYLLLIEFLTLLENCVGSTFVWNPV